MELYLIPSILSLVGNALLGIYVNVKSPKSKVTYAFTVLILLLMGWAFSETMMRSQSVETALFWSKVSYVHSFFLPSAFLALSYIYTGGRNLSLIVASYALGLIFFPFLLSSHFIQEIVLIPLWGYDTQVGYLFSYFAAVYVAIIGVGTLILLQHYRKSPPQEKRRLQFMIAGFLIAVFLIGMTNLLSRVANLPLPRAGSLFTLVATVSFAYGMVRYQLLIVLTREPPRATMDSRCGALCSSCSAYLEGFCPSCELGDIELRESCPIYRCSLERGIICNDCSALLKCSTYREYSNECPFSVDRYGLKVRTSYFWKDPDPSFAFEIFRDYTIRGSFGLLITRDYPEKVIERYELPDVSVLWLSQIGEYEASIDPTNLPRFTHTVSEFIRQAPISFVLLTGLEYLIVHNGFDRVLRHLHMINDQVMTHNSRLLVVADPRTLEAKELSLLEREMRTLRKDNLFKSPG